MAYETNTFTASKQASGGSGAVESSTYVDSGTTPGSGEQILREGSTFYDRASTRVEQLQRQDVTEQIRQYNDLYGGSDNTRATGLASSKSLEYAPAPTIQQAQRVQTTVAPFTFTLRGQIGLFGVENYYVRIALDIRTLLGDYQIGTYSDAQITPGPSETVDTYEPAEIIYDLDPPPPNPDPGDQEPPEKQASILCCAFIGGIPTDPILNCYYAAEFSDEKPTFPDPKVSVRLVNKGTGNIYIDTWLEPMMYTREREMWGYDTMYLNPKDFLFVGLHARNTRHLPYNVDVIIGEEVLTSGKIERQELIVTSTIAY